MERLFAPVAQVPVIDGFDKQRILDSLKTSGAVEVILLLRISQG